MRLNWFPFCSYLFIRLRVCLKFKRQFAIISLTVSEFSVLTALHFSIIARMRVSRGIFIWRHVASPSIFFPFCRRTPPPKKTCLQTDCHSNLKYDMKAEEIEWRGNKFGLVSSIVMASLELNGWNATRRAFITASNPHNYGSLMWRLRFRQFAILEWFSLCAILVKWTMIAHIRSITRLWILMECVFFPEIYEILHHVSHFRNFRT